MSFWHYWAPTLVASGAILCGGALVCFDRRVVRATGMLVGFCGLIAGFWIVISGPL